MEHIAPTKRIKEEYICPICEHGYEDMREYAECILKCSNRLEKQRELLECLEREQNDRKIAIEKMAIKLNTLIEEFEKQGFGKCTTTTVANRIKIDCSFGVVKRVLELRGGEI